jgi:hypothetical protein
VICTQRETLDPSNISIANWQLGFSLQRAGVVAALGITREGLYK